jgi:mannosyl-oligosaccharide alpha-1,2-mannosidase
MVSAALWTTLVGASSIGLLTSTVSAAAAPRPVAQEGAARAFVPTYQANATRAAAVQAAFDRSWKGYYDHAFPHDSLKPISKKGQDDRNGWGASAVDALSTAIVMGSAATVSEILDFIPTINFNETDSEVSLFETTIRYLGGLLSAYDLLTGPCKNLVPKDGGDAKVEALLSQAKVLAANLRVAFDTPSGVPDNSLYYDPKPRIAGSDTNGLATTGTLVLEWTRLSDLTGDPVYGELAQKGESYLLNPHPPSGEPFPGLLGITIFVENGTFANGIGGWGGGTDSYYEYLIKMYLYDPDRFGEYRDRWVLAVDSSIEHLISHPTSRPDLSFMSGFAGTTLRFQSGHLDCFHGGNFILGGIVLGEQKYIDHGLELARGCREAYAQTATGIGPESFAWQDNATSTDADNNGGPPDDQADFYERAGFWVQNGVYDLRPEVIESWYYAYRVTGDRTYQDWAWEAFLNINKTCAAGVGFSAITDINQVGGGQFYDSQESFWFAEVLKYSYLIHADESDFQVKTADNKFVYNTEAHPVAVSSTSSSRKSSRS